MDIRGITIHNTNNNKSARENYEDLLAERRVNVCHYLVDEEEAINTFSIDEQASHTGRGYDFGNRYTIAIEICRSTSDEALYLKAQDKAVELMKELMERFNLTTNNIYFHNDFNNVKCPHRTLEIYGTKRGFIDECFIQSR